MASYGVLSMSFYDYLLGVLPINLVELIAALCGSYYLIKHKNNVKKADKYFVFFLWITLVFELIGAYAPVAYFSNYSYFGFVKGTVFERNYWLFNVYTIGSFTFFMWYISRYIFNAFYKSLFKFLCIAFLIGSIIDIIINQTFFEHYSFLISISGTLILLFEILMFFYFVFKNETTIVIKRFLPVYLSIGILVYYLCITPFDVLMNYFTLSSGNNLFVSARIYVMLFSNVIMYGMFALGFILCSKKKKLR